MAAKTPLQVDLQAALQILVDDGLWARARMDRLDLSFVVIPYAGLRGAELAGCVLRNATLPYAALRTANLSRSDLRGADLSGAFLTRVNLRGALLERANL